MKHGNVWMSMTVVIGILSAAAGGAVPGGLDATVREMREMGVSVRGGVLPECGVYFVAIGRSRFRPGAVNRSREVAYANALKELASALRVSFKAHDASVLMLKQDAENVEVQACYRSVSESTVDQVLKGVQIVSSGENSAGEMEVVICAPAKMRDEGDALLKAQMTWGDKGVVRAVGIDADRAVAEKIALRSAVEQVAGTLVVGKMTVNEREDMHKCLATTAAALVEEYRIVTETKVDVEFRVEVLARVNKRKLYDSFRSFFKCLDDPVFCIIATDESLHRHFTQFFTDKGFRLCKDPQACQYLILLDGRFTDRPTPGNTKSNGTMLNLCIQIVSSDGRKPLLTMTERQAKDSEVLTPEQRREEVARRIFDKLEPRLHTEIQDMVVRMLDDADGGVVQ